MTDCLDKLRWRTVESSRLHRRSGELVYVCALVAWVLYKWHHEQGGQSRSWPDRSGCSDEEQELMKNL